MNIDFILLRGSKEAFVSIPFYNEELKKGIQNSYVEQLEKKGYNVYPVVDLEVMGADSMVRINYRLDNLIYGIITNENIYVCVAPEEMSDG